ncbi:hypothetical protein ACFOVU_02790 [Nocardiopsis sediminis]|uniref:Uncharacterized protein n=1 Tax=Nocardiopsis sediminis TaxID=1778267 RepID=A0ABV8FHH6_9ACTN
MRFLLMLLTRWRVPQSHGRHCRCCAFARWWNCPRCARTFLEPRPDYRCPGERKPPVLTPAPRHAKDVGVTFGDGLDDLRAELSPLLRELVATGGAR